MAIWQDRIGFLGEVDYTWGFFVRIDWADQNVYCYVLDVYSDGRRYSNLKLDCSHEEVITKLLVVLAYDVVIFSVVLQFYWLTVHKDHL